MTKSINIAYFRYSPDLPTPKDVMHFYEVMEHWFERLGQTPTHFAADDGYAGFFFKKDEYY